jgi:NADH pyrophosphatase NudC (nudix superfamily)
LKYLAPYVFRVAISNNRILKLDNDQVTFTYKKGDGGKPKRCTLPADKFIHRFLQHVLPKGFVKIRYYGLFSPGNRPLLRRVRTLLASADATSSQQAQSTTATQKADSFCPKCGQVMTLVHSIRPHKPP